MQSDVEKIAQLIQSLIDEGVKAKLKLVLQTVGGGLIASVTEPVFLKPPSGVKFTTKSKRSDAPPRILPCISTGCKKPSKGPRFRYCCDAHKGASLKQIALWRAQAARAAAPKKPVAK